MNPFKVDLSNDLMGGCYTGTIYVGASRLPTDVIIDTGSSTLAIEGHHYGSAEDVDCRPSHLAQAVSYGAGWWVGSLIRTSVAVRAGKDELLLKNVNLAVTQRESRHGFGKAQGILGLAYRSLDTAFKLKKPTWPALDVAEVDGSPETTVEPYFTQLEETGTVANVFALYTLRSRTHLGDPVQNRGYLVLGGGSECTDLYDGPFQSARIISDDFYDTNLKAIGLENVPPIAVPPGSSGPNSFVDSGADSIILPMQLYHRLFAKFTTLNPEFSNAISRARHSGSIPMSGRELKRWPPITIVLEGETGDVTLTIRADTYWQENATQRGEAVFVIRSEKGLQQAVLGLPLLNDHFCIFDRSADAGKGVIRFAAMVRPR